MEVAFSKAILASWEKKPVFADLRPYVSRSLADFVLHSALSWSNFFDADWNSAGKVS